MTTSMLVTDVWVCLCWWQPPHGNNNWRGNNDWLIDSFEKYGKQNCIFYSYHKYFHSVCHSTKGWWIIIMHTRIYTYSMQSRTSICGFCNVINTSFHIVSNIGGPGISERGFIIIQQQRKLKNIQNIDFSSNDFIKNCSTGSDEKKRK